MLANCMTNGLLFAEKGEWDSEGALACAIGRRQDNLASVV